MSFTLYYAPGSMSTIPHAVLEESGVPYQLSRLDPRAEADKPVGELSLYPSERITALGDDGFAVFETGAILLHILSTPQAAHLMPPPGSRDHTRFLRWLFYMEASLLPVMLETFHSDYWLVNDEDLKTVRDKAAKRVYAKVNLIEAHVSSGTFLYAGFSALDIYLTSMMRWSELIGLPVTLWPRIEVIVSAVRQRPAYLAMMQKQGIDWPEPDAPEKKRIKDRIFW